MGADEEVRGEDKQQDTDRVELEGARGKGCKEEKEVGGKVSGRRGEQGVYVHCGFMCVCKYVSIDLCIFVCVCVCHGQGGCVMAVPSGSSRRKNQ